MYILEYHDKKKIFVNWVSLYYCFSLLMSRSLISIFLVLYSINSFLELKKYPFVNNFNCLTTFGLFCQDVALASVSMRPIPFAPVLEKLSLSGNNYGSVRRFYIETSEDNAIPLPLQQSMINTNPPEQVFRLKGSDHSPFFSKPQALHKLLVEISAIPSAPVR